MTLDELARNHVVCEESRRKALVSGDIHEAYFHLMDMYASLLRVTSQGFSLDELFNEIYRLEEADSDETANEEDA